ncbi:amino acid transporter [Kineococcus sp. SYSU DK005]|uniref:amino acid transporter n=1 Tax=Kineococcus sp. SYSU DK005 TaxID=3383126 RepID=UPI003D7D9855
MRAPTTPQVPAPREPGERTGSGFRSWLLEGLTDRASRHPGPHGRGERGHPGHPWWRVMCLTGVDYFSTLGYQPAIAFLAAGVVSPLATLVLVLLTLFGALPVYRRVAAESPRGEGSIAMLERVLPFWGGKLFVLVLLGFAATDFLITITLSAADASKHLLENPYVPAALEDHQLGVTLLFITALAVVFLRGFSEAIGVAVVLVLVFLGLNAVVVVDAVVHVLGEPVALRAWWEALWAQGSSPFAVVGLALLVFPKLALGLSGFETGVVVMPQIAGGAGDEREQVARRVRGARRLLTTAALVMSAFLLASSLATSVLVPAEEFQPGGEANGRAMAYLAHAYLGNAVGTAYDVSTIAILWFAGASAMAGLLNLVPRYLPRYGMAPDWARAVRPLVLVFTAVAFLVTWVFDADVDAQGGAYATGVLVLITSAAVAVTLSARRRRERRATVLFGAISAVFAYTTVTNVVERPDGVKIAACFTAAILAVSLVSRARRSFELRASAVHFDAGALAVLDEVAARGAVNLIANEPDARDEAEYAEKEYDERRDQHIPDDQPAVFVEVTVTDPSEFSGELHVVGEERFGHHVLTVRTSSVANGIAAVALAVRDRTGVLPDVWFEWSEGNPLANLLRFLLLGVGEVAPVTREVLRRAVPEAAQRPRVHAG